jgi:hypothetical protein
MDQSKALQKLTEAADLVGMIEDLVRTSQSERLSGATVAGMRITLRNIREAVLSSHDVFAGDLVSRNRSRIETTVQPSTTSGEGIVTAQDSTMLNDPGRVAIRRQSLRASLDKIGPSGAAD